jgi:hypothetical protein
VSGHQPAHPAPRRATFNVKSRGPRAEPVARSWLVDRPRDWPMPRDGCLQVWSGVNWRRPPWLTFWTRHLGRKACTTPVLRCRSRCNSRWTLWTWRHLVDDPTELDLLSGFQPTAWTIGHGLLSGRPQVRVLPGARESAGSGATGFAGRGTIRCSTPRWYTRLAATSANADRLGGRRRRMSERSGWRTATRHAWCDPRRAASPGGERPDLRSTIGWRAANLGEDRSGSFEMLDCFAAPARCMKCVGEIAVHRCLAMTVAQLAEDLE